jgi:hypothetical protein
MCLQVREKSDKLVMEACILIFQDNMVAFVSRLSLLSWYHKVGFYTVRYVKVSTMLVSFVGSLVYLRILRCIRAVCGVKRFQEGL